MKRAIVERLLKILQLRNGSLHVNEIWTAAGSVGLLNLLHSEGAELWFYRRVQQQGITIPDALRAELRLAAQRTSIINMRIDAQTVAVIGLLNSAAIPWMLLKGQARRAATTRYPYADARPVSDVDLLLPEHAALGAWELLTRNGFRKAIEGPVDWKADHHLPTLIDVNNVAVELHTTTSMSVSPAEAWRRAADGCDAVEWSGINTTVPSPTELVWQALAHGSADGASGYYLKGFLSVSAILATDSEIDWAQIEQRLNANEVLDNDTGLPVPQEQIRRFLDVAAGLAGVAVPERLLPTHRANLAPLLQWRTNILASSKSRAVKGRLLEEAARVETELPLSPIIRTVGVWRNARRRTASIVARLAYVAWRAQS